jgi:hypothetical protein
VPGAGAILGYPMCTAAVAGALRSADVPKTLHGFLIAGEQPEAVARF